MTPIELRAADAQAHPRHAPGRRETVVADDSAGQYRTWALLLSNCPHRPPSKIPDGDCSRRRSPPATAWRLTVDTS
ncbi:unnamed protein product [Urochloa humidicola]